MCRNANVSRLVTCTGSRQGGKRERAHLWICESGISAIIRERDNFPARVDWFIPSTFPSFPRLHSNATTTPGENGIASAKTIRSYVSVAAAYMHLLKGAPTHSLVDVARELSHLLPRRYVSPRAIFPAHGDRFLTRSMP